MYTYTNAQKANAANDPQMQSKKLYGIEKEKNKPKYEMMTLVVSPREQTMHRHMEKNREKQKLEKSDVETPSQHQ